MMAARMREQSQCGRISARKMIKKLPSLTIGGHSKGDHPIIRTCLTQIRNIDYPRVRYIWVTPNRESSMKPIKEIFAGTDLLLLNDRWISEKYTGPHFIAQAWRQLQDNLDTDLYLFVDNDLSLIPRDIVRTLLRSEVPWDMIGPKTLMQGTGDIADSYPWEQIGSHGPYLKMRGFCMCWLIRTEVFKKVRITDPDPYFTTARKLHMMGYKLYVNPLAKTEHVNSSAHRRPGVMFFQGLGPRFLGKWNLNFLGVEKWNLKELMRLGYMSREDVAYYYSFLYMRGFHPPAPFDISDTFKEFNEFPVGHEHWREKFEKRC
jgi:hypothetical protein